MEFIIIIFLLIYSTTWLFYEKPYSKICVKLEKDWLLFYDVNLKPFLEKSFPHLYNTVPLNQKSHVFFKLR